MAAGAGRGWLGRGALLALQDRMNYAQTARDRAASGTGRRCRPRLATPEAETAVAAIDPNLPTTDCTPLGTRFMVISERKIPDLPDQCRARSPE